MSEKGLEQEVRKMLKAVYPDYQFAGIRKNKHGAIRVQYIHLLQLSQMDYYKLKREYESQIEG